MENSPSRLRESRVKLGMTLDALAGAVGVSKASMSRIETGRQQPSLEAVRKLAAVTGLLPEQIDPRLEGMLSGVSI